MIGSIIVSMFICFAITDLFKLEKKFKFILLFILLVAIALPIYRFSYNVPEVLYAFFDSPSPLCVILCIYFIVNFFVEKAPKIESNAFVVIAIFGFLFYINYMGFLGPSIYHSNVVIQGLFAFIFALFIGLVSKNMRLLIVGALCFSALNPQISLIESLICPYLWIFSCFYCLILGFKFISKSMQRSKNV